MEMPWDRPDRFERGPQAEKRRTARERARLNAVIGILAFLAFLLGSIPPPAFALALLRFGTIPFYLAWMGLGVGLVASLGYLRWRFEHRSWKEVALVMGTWAALVAWRAHESAAERIDIITLEIADLSWDPVSKEVVVDTYADPDLLRAMRWGAIRADAAVGGDSIVDETHIAKFVAGTQGLLESKATLPMLASGDPRRAVRTKLFRIAWPRGAEMREVLPNRVAVRLLSGRGQPLGKTLLVSLTKYDIFQLNGGPWQIRRRD